MIPAVKRSGADLRVASLATTRLDARTKAVGHRYAIRIFAPDGSRLRPASARLGARGPTAGHPVISGAGLRVAGLGVGRRRAGTKVVGYRYTIVPLAPDASRLRPASAGFVARTPTTVVCPGIRINFPRFSLAGETYVK